MDRNGTVSRLLLFLLALLSTLNLLLGEKVTLEELQELSVAAADERIWYGDDKLQFGDLRLPSGEGPHPVVIVIHGGCWLSHLDLEYISPMNAALTDNGLATWSLEYRRVGNPGGGWPGTLEDVARGADYLKVLAKKYPLDLSRVVTVGHSAGGHLALWLATRSLLPVDSPLYVDDPLLVQGAVSLAGVTDLRRSIDPRTEVCQGSAVQLLGGTPDEVPVRYDVASPIQLLPFGVPQRLIHGDQDEVVPLDYSLKFAEMARSRGDDSEVIVLEKGGHFEPVTPHIPAWEKVKDAILSLVGDSDNVH